MCHLEPISNMETTRNYHCNNQEKMVEYFESGDYVVHFFTDDPMYRALIMSRYEEAVTTGLLKMGPTIYDEALAKNTSSGITTKTLWSRQPIPIEIPSLP